MWFIKKTPKKESDILLEEIKNILFPPLESYTDKENNKFQIDYSVDTNIDSVVTDLQDGYNDDMTVNTLKKISERVSSIRKLLDFDQKIDKDTQYVVVDDGVNKDD